MVNPPLAAPHPRAAALSTRATRLIIAAAIALATVALLVATNPPVGITWDEPAYIVASDSYMQWFGIVRDARGMALQSSLLDALWSPNHEHPPLAKIWMGLFVPLGGALGMDDLGAHRLGNMVLVGAMLAALFLMVASAAGSRAGLLAVASLLAMPRFFFHAHLAALDIPAAACVVLLTALFWFARERRSLWWSLLFAIGWGVGLGFKVNVAFVMPALAIWMLLCWRRWHLFWRLAIASLLGPPLFVALWPWLYNSTADRLYDYIAFLTWNHWQNGQFYLGHFVRPPPWHFPFITAYAVTPLGILLAALVGLIAGLRAPAAPKLASPAAPNTVRAAAALFAIGALVPLLALTTGKSMVYDQERMFMPAFPFIAALAGLGLDAAVRWVAARRDGAGQSSAGLRRAIAAAIPLGVLAPPLVAAALLWPHLLSFYSAGVGGLPGAVGLGFERTYWTDGYAAAIPYLNANAKRGAIVWSETWSHDDLIAYQRMGQLRADLRIAMPRGVHSIFADDGFDGVEAERHEADVLLFAMRDTWLVNDADARSIIAGRAPDFAIDRMGVRLLAVYNVNR